MKSAALAALLTVACTHPAPVPARPPPRPESPDAGLALDAAPDAARDAGVAAIQPLGAVFARMVSSSVKGNTVLVTVAAGTREGIGPGWHATVLRGDSDKALDGGEIDVVRIGERMTIGRTRLTIEQIRANLRVRFDPPRP